METRSETSDEQITALQTPMPLPVKVGAPSRYVWLQLGSILVPGTVILLETWVIAAAPHPLLAAADNALAPLSVATLLIWGVAAVAAAYMVGTWVREVAFAALLPRSRDGLHLLGSLPFIGDVVTPRAALENLATEFQLTEDHKEELDAPSVSVSTRAFLQHHKPLEWTLRSGDRIAALAYSKTWLKAHYEDLTLEDIGVEINLVAGLTVPLLLAPIAITRWLAASSEWLALAIFFGALCAILAGRRTRTLARYELEDAFRNLALAAWVNETNPITEVTAAVNHSATDMSPSG